MKRIPPLTVCMALLLWGSTLWGQSVLTQADRDNAVEHLKNSQAEMMSAIKGLTEAQLNFKSSDESWSIAECVEHLAISESSLFGAVSESLKTDADASRRSEIQLSDDQVLGIITNRTQKIKTQTYLEPKNGFGSYSGSLKEFKTRRKENIKFVKATPNDLRSHYVDFPFGLVDSYQVILFMSGHTERHTAQIREVKEQQGFPSS